MRFLLTTILSFLCLFVIGQEKAIDTTLLNSYEIDLGAGINYQFSTFGNTGFNSVKISPLLQRRINEPDVRANWNLFNDLVSDNPSFHGSYFFKFGVKFKIGKKLSISSSINAEQRGFSDGVFSNRTRNFYPYFNATYKNKIGRFSYLFQAGDFRNFKLYEGLTFYNLETQSWIFKLKYEDFYIKHAGVGDLLVGIGLGIDDLYDYSFGIEDVELNQDSTAILDLRLGYSSNRRSLGQGFWNFSGNIEFQGISSFYSQVSFSNNDKMAFLLGIKIESQPFDKIEINSFFEYRNYNSNFNLGYSNLVYYRDPNQLASFANSTNNVFVPLDYYERNFSQWAVFTEYQNIDISGLNFNSNIKYNFSGNTFFNMMFDFNWIISNEENIFYPFYNLGIGVRPTQLTEISLELTNKVINLDKNYPTFYSTNKPYFQLRLYKPLKFTKGNDRQHQKS